MKEENSEEDKVRFLFFRSWSGVYGFVLFVLAIFIALFYLVTINFS